MTKILNKRAQEMWFVKRELQIWGCIAFLLLMMPVLATTLTFVTFSSTGMHAPLRHLPSFLLGYARVGDTRSIDGVGHFLTPDKAFTALAFFSNLRFPLTNLGTSINTAIQLRTSIGRLSAFMVRQNVRSMYIRSTASSSSSSLSTGGTASGNDNLISITNGCFSWLGATAPKTKAGEKKKPSNGKASSIPAAMATVTAGVPITLTVAPVVAPTTGSNGAPASPSAAAATKGEFQLRDVNMSALRGDLLTIVGTVGSGKSTLVDGILGEATIINGSMHVNGHIAYVAQQAWVNQPIHNHCMITYIHIYIYFYHMVLLYDNGDVVWCGWLMNRY